MSGRRIEFEIGELVLHGFAPGEGRAIGDALQRELAASLSGWRPEASRDVAHFDAGTVIVPAGAPPTAVGAGVARRIRRSVA